MNDPAIDAFIDASRAWEADEIARIRLSERRAWRFAALGMGAGVVGCIAVALLTPLKTVEPFIVRVDRTTGAADIVTRIDERTVTFDEAIDKYFLARYVNYREEYAEAAAYPNYRAVKVMSGDVAGRAYVRQVDPKNPNSPSRVYGKDGGVEVAVRSIAFLTKGVAQVRFSRKEHGGPASAKESHWIATITYIYRNAPIDAQTQLVNPVGFHVTDYRLDPETTGGER
ncbi:type IV secretion system protein VirB8 [Luteibacter rhizovicinus]|uniref:Type IV secretion system protein VirB8 n=1 Tax=Luteibacter rhizovicinus TaxID=242606 RepID=A0A4R3YQS0_9GAMM|nr:VirB8/TrbF family protein [Luteibacter rhizovicinus]TCV94761.1 type IV secretion system protein VirB8 [Luteibacter rhizovicinus]